MKSGGHDEWGKKLFQMCDMPTWHLIDGIKALQTSKQYFLCLHHNHIFRLRRLPLCQSLFRLFLSSVIAPPQPPPFEGIHLQGGEDP